MNQRRIIVRCAKLGVRFIEIISLPIIFPAAFLMKTIRRIGLWRLTIIRKIFYSLGVLPIRDHYYEPLINPNKLKRSLAIDRSLPGLDLNVSYQLGLLSQFQFSREFPARYEKSSGVYGYRFENKYFTGGDAEYYYQLIRHFRPKNIIEIGGGFSMLLALDATAQNTAEGFPACNILCVEPYENTWLEKAPVSLLRQYIEDVDLAVFRSLQAGDVLFIDSSHMIRPQGDVLFEYFEILPTLAKGVLIHIHDIFTPKDYPEDWVVNDARLWNEQYLVEAFLMMNSQFSIVGALNYLWHHHYDEFAAKCSHLKKNIDTDRRHLEPSSLWIVKN
jgi:hypothetical protein